ncbi:MAG: hypothetical protein HY075_13225, partial [Deltaproteobacteria bacterium]|nr:hypothetical protein [Deltaproteobacteria bacterium]
DRIEAALAGHEPGGVEVSVERIYVSTREVVVNVSVDDTDRLEAVREEVVGALKSMPGLAFVGAPGRVKVE